MSVVPSFRKAPSLTIRSPGSIPAWRAAVLPTRMNEVTPTRASSSTAIAVEGQPIPVEVTVTSRPLYVPTIVRCSRLWATSRGLSRYSATSGTRNGSPGRSATVLTSPGATSMWNWRTPRPVLLLSTMNPNAAAPSRCGDGHSRRAARPPKGLGLVTCATMRRDARPTRRPAHRLSGERDHCLCRPPAVRRRHPCRRQRGAARRRCRPRPSNRVRQRRRWPAPSPSRSAS